MTGDAKTGGGATQRVSWARHGYVLLASLFGVCVLVQTYIAGMAVFVDPAHWAFHRAFVHLFEPLLVLLLVVAFVGKLPRHLKLVPVGLFVLLSVQYATVNAFGSAVAALHPVNAVVIFAVTVVAVKRALSWTGTTAARVQ